eukprot:Sdes_comp16593_c0_seq1m5906
MAVNLSQETLLNSSTLVVSSQQQPVLGFEDAEDFDMASGDELSLDTPTVSPQKKKKVPLEFISSKSSAQESKINPNYHLETRQQLLKLFQMDVHQVIQIAVASSQIISEITPELINFFSSLTKIFCHGLKPRNYLQRFLHSTTDEKYSSAEADDFWFLLQSMEAKSIPSPTA